MHPRRLLRDDLRAAVEAALSGVPVHVSRARGLKPGEDEAVLIYVMSERIERHPASKNRGAGPLRRTISADVVIICDGRDGEVVDRLDDLCRSAELSISALPGVELTGTTVEIDGQAQTVRAVGVLTLSADRLDMLTE